jgi:hypothetical protein
VSTTLEKIEVACPQCGRPLLVPASAAGKTGRCPTCKHIFPLQVAEADDFQAVGSPSAPLDHVQQSPPPRLPAAAPAWAANSGSRPAVPPGAQVEKGKYNHGFGWEHRGWDKGMLGGLMLMAVGAAWFLGGWAVGIHFHYPIVLFVVGLVGFFRGLITGNVTGNSAGR